MKKKNIFIILLSAALLLNFYKDDHYFEIAKNIDIFTRMVKVIDTYFVDEIEPEKFIRKGIDEMLRSLDPYTNFIGASEIEDFRFMSTGKYGGVGAVIQRRGKYVIISEIYENAPAHKAGLQVGDTLMYIENEKIYDVKDLTKVRDLLRGQPGTKVIVKVKRIGIKYLLPITITRGNIKIKSVPYSNVIRNHIGYVRLTSFTQNASEDVKNAILKLKEKDPQLKGIVLDLRNNPGGLLMEAVNISNLFVDKGEKIVETKGRVPSANNVYFATKEPLDTKIPLVVCINGNSASASEIVAGVMKDLDRGVIVGKRSYGKGLVQVSKPLSYNTQVKLTIARYYTPSGRCIQARQYSHDSKNSVVKVPDSLRKEYTTRAGRKVYDAGGIEPDSTTPKITYHPITQFLMSKNIIFDYATLYLYKHKNEIPEDNLENFTLTDKEYDEFVKFAKKHPDYDYKPPIAKELKELKEKMEKEKYYDDNIKRKIEELEKIVKEHSEKDIITNKEEIKELIELEIVGRIGFRKARLAKALKKDIDIDASEYFLTHPEAYNKVLMK